MLFENFPLHETLLKNLKDMGFEAPTEIQSQIMPLALEGKDVSGLSRTGTGKTAAFLIPTIQRLSQLEPDRLALCLAPTRELAQQIEGETKLIGKDLGIGSVSIVGGMSSEDQIDALKKGARVIAGTPGRVIDLFKERALDLSKVDVLVFDEADRMFDMGFIRDMQYILGKVNPKRQILLFSATMNFSVLNMLYEYGANPQEINVSRDQLTAEKIQQLLYQVGDREKPQFLLGVCRKHSPGNGSIIVFVNYKERVPWVAALLTRNGIPAEGLSSLLRQERRNKIIQGFKTGKFRALVATDVASRGLDVDDVSLVVNYHLPEEAATYVHRIGRTARAGKDGIAVALSSSEDAYNQMRIEEFLGHKIPVEWLADEELPKDVQMPGRVVDEDGEEGAGSGEGGGGEGRHARGDRGGRGRGGDRDRGGRGGRDRGGRGGDRGGRGRREERGDRPPREEAPVAAAAEGMDDAGASVAAEERIEQPPMREQSREPRRDDERRSRERHGGDDRRDRGDRGDRGGRGERGGRDRGDRGRDRGRGRERDRDFGSRGDRELPGREGRMAPADMPSPLVGNPVIYDMKSGKAKNRSDAEYDRFVRDYDSNLRSSEEKFAGKKKAAPAIIKKISSKVTALFGKRGE